MKKAIFGYNVHEVDSVISQLISQKEMLLQHNDYLKDEINNLQSRLNETETESVATETDAWKELEKAIKRVISEEKDDGNPDSFFNKIKDIYNSAKS